MRAIHPGEILEDELEELDELEESEDDDEEKDLDLFFFFPFFDELFDNFLFLVGEGELELLDDEDED